MPLHLPATSAAHAAPLADAPLLADAGPLAGEHVLLLGPDIALMCALIRSGCQAVTELEQQDRPEAQSVGLVVAPRVRSVEAARTVIAHARRALTPCGRLLLRLPAELAMPSLDMAFLEQGFTRPRRRATADGMVLSAERPMFGPLARA